MPGPRPGGLVTLLLINHKNKMSAYQKSRNSSHISVMDEARSDGVGVDVIVWLHTSINDCSLSIVLSTRSSL